MVARDDDQAVADILAELLAAGDIGLFLEHGVVVFIKIIIIWITHLRCL